MYSYYNINPYDCYNSLHQQRPVYSFTENLNKALDLIREAVGNEQADEDFYNFLIESAPAEDKAILESIRDNERKHFIMFRQIYCDLTGQVLPINPTPRFIQPATYCQGIAKALFGELEAVERYRQILFALQNRQHINVLTEIITDEQMHATKLNFLYSKNECYEEWEE